MSFLDKLFKKESSVSDFLIRPSVGSAIARPRTFLNMVLDASSSMDDVRAETIAAYNAFIESQRHDRIDELFVTLTTFSSANQIRTHYKSVPIEHVQPLTERQYEPDGMTALYDGVFRTLKDLDKATRPGDRLLTVVLTDGEDNQSVEVPTAQELKRIIDARTARGNHTFVFLASTISAYKSSASMGFSQGNTRSYGAGDVGDALATVSNGVTGYRHSDGMQTDNFFGAQKWRRTSWAAGPEAADEKPPV